jgi:hypothetical protein
LVLAVPSVPPHPGPAFVELALTEIADGLGGRSANEPFEDRFADGERTFDYRMKPGVVRHANVLALMRAVGIEV